MKAKVRQVAHKFSLQVRSINVSEDGLRVDNGTHCCTFCLFVDVHFLNLHIQVKCNVLSKYLMASVLN